MSARVAPGSRSCGLGLLLGLGSGFGFHCVLASAVPQWSAAFSWLASIRVVQRPARGGGNDHGGGLSGIGCWP
jgi:hypothetical protein